MYLGTYPMKSADNWKVEIASVSSGMDYIVTGPYRSWAQSALLIGAGHRSIPFACEVLRLVRDVEGAL